jgi:hypothetical protein
MVNGSGLLTPLVVKRAATRCYPYTIVLLPECITHVFVVVWTHHAMRDIIGLEWHVHYGDIQQR